MKEITGKASGSRRKEVIARWRVAGQGEEEFKVMGKGKFTIKGTVNHENLKTGGTKHE